MPKFRFRVLHSTHSQDGKRYKRDDIILSDVDLSLMFPGHLARELDDTSKPAEGLMEKKRLPEVPPPETKKEASEVADDKSEIDEEDEDEEVSYGEIDEEDEDEEVSYGEDVTADFTIAADKGVQVFMDDAGKYTVTSGQEVIVTGVGKVAAKAAIKSQE